MRSPELSREHHVEFAAQAAGNRCAGLDAAARDREHDGIVEGLAAESLHEDPAGFLTVSEGAVIHR
jgi:hypothetical protein